MQRSIEILVGRLMTDQAFRRLFLSNPGLTLRQASELGLTLTDTEVRAILETDRSIWEDAARELRNLQITM